MKERIRRLGAGSVAAVLLAGLNGGAAAQAQPDGATGTIAGEVVDAESGEPITEVNVVVVGTGLGTVTDAAGRYTIAGVRDGSYEVRASRIGYGGSSRADEDGAVRSGRT